MLVPWCAEAPKACNTRLQRPVGQWKHGSVLQAGGTWLSIKACAIGLSQLHHDEKDMLLARLVGARWTRVSAQRAQFGRGACMALR